VSEIRIEPLTGALGAEVLGVNLARDLANDNFTAIREALLDYGVIFFRDQELDIPAHKAFASRFGKLFLHPNIQGSKADPAVIDIVRNPGDTRIIGEDWHSDTPQVPQPPMDRCCTPSTCRRTEATRCSRASTPRTTPCRQD
jgi:taurine dioxygenase